MRSLSIGNSFSQDACAYLHQVAASADVDWECVNLIIGGCSLETHAKNLREDNPLYSLEINGETTGRLVSIRQALTELGSFDVVTLQQASHFSGMAETYYPFIDEVYAAVREWQPDAEILLHETWAYETDSQHPAFPNYGKDQRRMYESLRDAYYGAARHLGIGLIPVGDMIQTIRMNLPEFDYANGGLSLNRDGFHLSIPIGRMLAAYVWFERIAPLFYPGASVQKAFFVPEGCDEKTIALLEALREEVRTGF